MLWQQKAPEAVLKRKKVPVKTAIAFRSVEQQNLIFQACQCRIHAAEGKWIAS